MPKRNLVADIRLLPNERLLHRYIDLHERRQGYFDKHYHCSIPYRIEEEFRMALTLLRYAEQRSDPLLFYSLGTAEGTMARALSELSEGKIKSLCCSPNRENQDCYMAYGEPRDSDFFLGPFHRLTKDHLRAYAKISAAAGGFDVIFEDTTFQMYSPNRCKQIEFVRHHLKDDGVLVMLEKFCATDQAEFTRREQQKDYGFKARYFPPSEIWKKAENVLSYMHENQVTLDEMSAALSRQFKHVVVTWNSGNFYGLAASNCATNLNRFVAAMPAPAIPREYLYASLSEEIAAL